MWTYKCDRCGAALDPGERCDCQDRPAKYNGKPIFTQENFNYSEAKIGDYVEQAVVGEPFHKTVPSPAGEWPNGIWQFCGCCFQGETVPRGKDPIYC